MSKKVPLFAKETDLCASFIEALGIHNAKVVASQNPNWDAHRWTSYAETAGWDILLVSKNDGTQIGIEAKLKLTVEVLNQALGDRWRGEYVSGPDYRAVLVPDDAVQNGIENLAAKLGVVVLTQRPPNQYQKDHHFSPNLPHIGPTGWGHEWPNWLPHHREKLPEYVPDVCAGDAAPLQLSDWKIQALKIQAILAERPVLRTDFTALKINMSRWTQFWLTKTPQGWVQNNKTPDFAALHPSIYAQVLADKEKWMPDPVLLAKDKTA
jgi:hypothetical protein